jgi:hypothetical protein
VALQLLDALPARAIVPADKAYDGDAVRSLIQEQSAVPNIAPKASLWWCSTEGSACTGDCSTYQNNQVRWFVA